MKTKKSIELTSDGYFPNRTEECGICSLANLIYIKYQDFETAKKLFEKSKEHPLVEINGTTKVYILPKILEDLSDHKYSGIAYIPPTFDISKEYDESSKISFDSLKKVFQNNLEKGLINLEEKCEIDGPHGIFIRNKDNNMGHMFVNIDNKSEKTFVNNGYLSTFPEGNNELCGIFEITKHHQ